MTTEDDAGAEIYIVAMRQHRGQPRGLERHITLEALAEMFEIATATVRQKCRRSRRPWPHHKHPIPGGMTPTFCEHDIEWIKNELQTEADD